MRKKACFPPIGDYSVLSDILIERLLDYEAVKCPPMTKRTMEIGARYSPDMVCTPFKILLGNQIEAAELGATVFLMPGAGCRLGFYDILQKQILTDLGYECEMICLFDYAPNRNRLYQTLSAVNPDLTEDRYNRVFDLLIRITRDMDSLGYYMRRNMAFETEKGTFERVYHRYLTAVKDAQTAEEAGRLAASYKQEMEKIPVNKPERPIRIGVIGEIYMIAEPFSNLRLENWLIKHGVELIRPGCLTTFAEAMFTIPEQIKESGGYVKYNIGATANDVIRDAYRMLNAPEEDAVDGIIHIKPASCSPEITAMTILTNMARDYNMPLMFLTFDTETSEAGLYTRLEAFIDMIEMKESAAKISVLSRQMAF